jgi:hypothetical protein
LSKVGEGFVRVVQPMPGAVHGDEGVLDDLLSVMRVAQE